MFEAQSPSPDCSGISRFFIGNTAESGKQLQIIKIIQIHLTNGYPSEFHLSGIDFKDISVDANRAYVCGTNSTVLYSPDIATTTFAFTSGVHQGVDFEGISITPTEPRTFAVGNGSRIYHFDLLSGTQVKNVFSDSISDVHFANANVGTIAGKGFFVRQTHDGGASWEIVRPSNNVSTQLGADIHRVWTRENGFALLGGVNYLATVTGSLSTNQGFTGTVRRFRFAANNPLNGLMAVDGKVQKLALAPSGAGYTATPGTAYTSAATVLYGLHVFENGNVMAVGTSMFTGYLDIAAGTWTDFSPGSSSALTFRDVFFHDDVVGYTAGNDGVMLRSSDVTIDPVTHAITALTWTGKLADTYPQALANTTGRLNLTSIAFGSRYEGVFGGNYNSTYVNPGNAACVRKVHDESGDFSTRFFYDRLGRLVVSQNARQHDPALLSAYSKFSYSLYDELGRVYEAGEKAENLSVGFANMFPSIFGTMVGDQHIPTVIDDAKLQAWLDGVGARTEVTRSHYDATVITGLPASFTPDASTQRKRITHVTYEAVYDGDDQTYDHATHYDYDIHGNVKTLLQDNQLMAADPMLDNNRFKRMDYNYDLISGNVHRVSYQHGEADQWHHAYTYDADNRITEAYTTTTTPLTDPALGQTASENEPGLTPYWDREVEYEYYAHGPLARTELGQHDVQGLDYVYTIQGWMKGVNSNTLDVTRDPGADGNGIGVARDAYGFSLHYFDGDYVDIGGIIAADHPFADQTGSDLLTNSDDLYNGNIGRMVTTITNPTTRDILPLGNAYKYDQLNRLVEANSFTNLNLGTNAWGSGQSAKYHNAFAYDANGNILKQLRRNETGADIDSLNYRYKRNSNGEIVQNRLYHVKDQVSNVDFGDDIDDMGSFDGDADDINVLNNYIYDAEGRLIQDKQERIEIEWRVDGKVLKIIRPDTSVRKNLIFEYDAMGNRIAKHVLTALNVLEKSTYYVLDASGNTMSVYERVVDEMEESVAFYQAEKHIYGSSRLGIMNDSISLLGTENEDYSMYLTDHVIGNRYYELNNHLGNVLSIISDKPMPHDDDTDGEVDWYLADIRVAQDYSPFGVTLSGRNFTLAGAEKGRYGFNSMEKDDEIKGDGNSYDFGARMYDNRLGRFLCIDPLTSIYPNYSPYNNSVNNPIMFIDKNGEGPIIGWQMTGAHKDPVSGKLKVEFSITVQRNIFIHNSSTMDLPMNDIAQNIQSSYSSMDFSYSLSTSENTEMRAYLELQYTHLSAADIASAEITVNINFEANVSYVASLDKITDPQATVIQFVDDIPSTTNSETGLVDPAGVAYTANGDAIRVEAKYASTKDINTPKYSIKGYQVTVHELFHLDGADDLYKNDNKGNQLKDSPTLMGKAGKNFGLANITRQEVAMNYFRQAKNATHMIHKKINNKHFPDLSNVKVTNKSGSARYDTNPKETGVEGLK